MRLIYDIETDNLINKLTRMWCLYAYDLDSCQFKYWLEGDLGWMEWFDKAEVVIGHNIVGFDNLALRKLFGYEVKAKSIDTMLMSAIMNYRRFGNLGHSLENWGQLLGHKKMDILQVYIDKGLLPPNAKREDVFKVWDDSMLEYCKRDVEVTYGAYKTTLEEFNKTKPYAPYLSTYIKAEHAVAKWCADANYYGWPFDVEAATALFNVLSAELTSAYEQLLPKLGMKCVALDKKNGEVEVKYPKWTKNGYYHHHTASYFGVPVESGLDDEELNQFPFHRMIQGPFCRVKFEALSLDSVEDVKLFLFRNGWEPSEYNYKFDPKTRRRVETSPKITEDSLEFIGGDGKLYLDFLVARSRHSILKTWLENVDEKGFLHGDCHTIGTPSMRMRHSVIVNVPSGEIDKNGIAVSKYGPEMRALFKSLPGWSVVGCDSKGNQARGLAHYLSNEEFTDLLLNGDIHQFNADTLTSILKNIMKIDHVVPRHVAKRILYAFLFGAGGAKLWGYIFGKPNQTQGNQLKREFLKAVPGFQALIDRLSAIYGKTSQSGDGYIPSLAGNRLYVDSFHKLLVYLLQGCEKVTCGTAVMLAAETMEKEGIPYFPLIFMHDEFQVMVPDEHVKRVKEIGIMAFREGPKLYDVQIMDGDGKIGKNWFDTH